MNIFALLSACYCAALAAALLASELQGWRVDRLERRWADAMAALVREVAA